MPCIFARYTEIAGYKIESKNKKDNSNKKIFQYFEEIEIGNSTSSKICNHVGRFLEWCDKNSLQSEVKLEHHSAFPSEIINDYINEYGIEQCYWSESTADEAVNALQSYYDFLSFFLIIKLRQLM